MNNKPLSKEEWKDVPNYETFYKISTLGKVYCYALGREIAYSKDRGYLMVGLRKNGVQKTYRLHRLVALTFTPNPHNKPYINHINGNKADNSVCNLEWCTPMENSTHAKHNNLLKSPKGEKHGRSILTEAQVREIKKSNLTHRPLAKQYGVARQTIQEIKNGYRWKHVV